MTTQIVDKLADGSTVKVTAATDELALAALQFCKSQTPQVSTDAGFDAAIDGLNSVAALRAIVKILAKSLVKVG